MIRPEHTHVFSVGISSYGLGVDWYLPHASEHALKFSAFAKRANVPADHIHLFLSTAEITLLRPQLEAAGLAARPATFVDIVDFIEKKLTSYTGDLLYMFWAGHGSLSDDARRVLFFEDLTHKSQVPFDFNDFFARLRTSSFERFGTQIVFIDACANRFQELGFDASLGQAKAGKGRWSHAGIHQLFFLAADSGEQAKEGAFGAAVLRALGDPKAQGALWPPDQDKIVQAVRPQFEGSAQRPVQLIWTTSEGDEFTVERTSGDLPASRFVNAVALSRNMSVRALRRLADIALSYANFADSSEKGAAERDQRYARLCQATNRPIASLKRSTPRIEMLHIVAAALQWGAEAWLATELGQQAPAAEFSVELERIALINEVRALVGALPATINQLRDEYLKTMRRMSQERDREDAMTLDAMLDELYQISAAAEPQRPVWEFLLRLADRFPTTRATIDAFLEGHVRLAVTLNTIRAELSKEQRFILSISLNPADSEAPRIESVNARVTILDTFNIVRTFDPQPTATWDSVGLSVAAIVKETRRLVMEQYLRDESALIIEFLMPAEFLSHSPELFPIKLKAGSIPLGRLHSVVLRLRERIAQRADAINLEEWERIASQVDRDRASTIHWMDKTRTSPTVDTCKGLVVLQFLPTDDLLEVINVGFPFLAWLRREPLAGDWQGFVTAFEAWAAKLPFNRLPMDVRLIRRQPTDLGVHLTLFWDDPNHAGHWSRLAEVSTGG